MYLLNQPITSSFECAEFARQKWVRILDRESVYAIYLNDKFEIEYISQLNVSNYRKTNFNAREAIQIALFMHLDNVILLHNHLGGDVTPSAIDIQLTLSALPHYAFFEIHVIDHLIIDRNNHYSMADNHLLDFG